jgi:hypothetical protein
MVVGGMMLETVYRKTISKCSGVNSFSYVTIAKCSGVNSFSYVQLL